MIDAGSLEYAHARLCARYGDRPDELAWRRIETLRDFPAMLEAVRASYLGAWIADIGPDSDVHAIEFAIRAHWRGRVAAIAAWMPAAWRSAIEWCGLMVDLPVLQHLARGGAPPPWLRTDPLADLLRNDPPSRTRSAVAVLLEAGRADPDHLGQLWYVGWQQRLPGRGAQPVQLAAFARLLAAHAAAFADPLQHDGWAQRRTLHARLTQQFRRAALDPAAAFIFLTLSALDGERLRGELVRRAAFPRLQLAS